MFRGAGRRAIFAMIVQIVFISMIPHLYPMGCGTGARVLYGTTSSRIFNLNVYHIQMKF
jgi:hypothetical protein